jgi:hypothetical protein
MTLIGFANTQPPAVGVHPPTDCVHVLSEGALGLQIMPWRCKGEPLACQVYPLCGHELLSNQSPKPLANISRKFVPPLLSPMV